ncbi:MAG: ATP-binding protein [Cyanobacteria bacterium]|nr:ATP-binding protein [Cyanobacteriota bacterium]MDA1020596.1 ATP-binding protein [Cyanobacteriota bacterium]
MDNFIQQRILQSNPQWQDSSYRPELALANTRAIYKELVQSLDDRMIISLVGLRRTGKSTLLFQLQDHVLQKVNDSKQVFFFSFDEKLQEQDPQALEAILNYYFDAVLKTNPRTLKEKVYIFLDEVQYIEHWQSILKNLYDSSSKIKFIISGSFSLKLAKQDRESLAGRIAESYIAPLDFADYLTIKSQIKEPCAIKLNKIDNQSFKDLDFDLFNQKYQDQFIDFILHGSFPETINIENLDKKFDYIENSVINKLVENDIPKIYKINKRNELKSLVKCLIQDSSSIFENKNLAEATGLQRNSISKYLEALEASFFLDIVPSHHRSAHKARKTRKKVYVISPNFLPALLRLKRDNSLLNDIMGKLVETYVYQKLKSYREFTNIHFFRKGSNEIDFIAGDFLLNKKTEWTYIEVKYKNNINSSDIKFLLKHIKQNQIPSAIVITKNKLAINDYDGHKVYFIPALLI